MERPERGRIIGDGSMDQWEGDRLFRRNVAPHAPGHALNTIGGRAAFFPIRPMRTEGFG